jgi:putative ABC transport system permease protein
LAIPLKYNLRNLMVRRISSLMTVFTIALVVGVFIAIMALANGLSQALVSTGSADNILVMRQSAQREVQSVVTRDSYQIIQTLPGVARDADGKPITSAERTVLVNIPRRNGQPSNVTVRGVSQAGFSMRPQLKIVEGRAFRTGVGEAIASRRIAERFAHTSIGDELNMGRKTWKIVGIFDAGGTAFDSEIWSDVDDVGDAFDRREYSSVLVRIAPGITPDQFASRVESEQRLNLEAKSELKYYEEQTSSAAPIKGLGTFVAIILGIGACFGGMNTMYAAVAARTKEIGTLRALGFSRISILTSFVIESLILSFFGGLAGILISLPVQGITTGTTNFRTFSEIAFSFQLSAGLLVTAIIFAAVMGFVGGLLPARMAARLPITRALRQL